MQQEQIGTSSDKFKPRPDQATLCPQESSEPSTAAALPQEQALQTSLPARPLSPEQDLVSKTYQKFLASCAAGANEVVSSLKELLLSLRSSRLPEEVPQFLQVFHDTASGFGRFEKRIECIMEVAEFCAHTPQVSRRLRTMLFQMMRACSPTDRQLVADLLETKLSAVPASRRAIFHSLLLFSTKNFAELYALIGHSGARKLFDFKSRELSAKVADAVVTARLRKIRRPAPLRKTALSVAVRRKFESLKESIEREQEMLQKLGWFSKTEPAKRALKACEELQRYLQKEWKKAGKTRERIEVCNTVSQLLKVHRQYNMKVCAEWSADKRLVKARWTSQEALDLSTGLKKIPEVLIIATGPFRNIVRQRGTQEDVFGEWLPDGRIHLYDAASNNMRSAHYNRISPFKLTVTHEGLHALKFGWHFDGPSRKSDIRELVCQSAAFVNLADFLRISGWQVLDPASYRSLNGGSAVEIDGIPYATDKVVRFGNDSVIFRYNAALKTLFSHRAEAAFVLESYSSVNPWEDFCESLTVYLYIPRQLIDHAPLKFIFAEQLFGLYQADKELNQRLQSRLMRKRAR